MHLYLYAPYRLFTGDGGAQNYTELTFKESQTLLVSVFDKVQTVFYWMVPEEICDSFKNYNIMPQYDGNVSLDTSCSSCSSQLNYAGSDYSESDQDPDLEAACSIPVVTTNRDSNYSTQCDSPPAWYEEYIPGVSDPRQSKLNRKTIRRDNRLLITEALPILSVSNLRSFWPKQNNFIEDLKMRDISCAMLSEVWEKANCRKQQFELEKMLNMDGLKYISTPRITKRGGGAAIVAQLKNYSLDKIEVPNPNKFEVVFGILRPKKTTCRIKEIIIAAFYSPPKSKKNPKLLDHLLSNTLYLLAKYPNAGLCIRGTEITGIYLLLYKLSLNLPIGVRY